MRKRAMISVNIAVLLFGLAGLVAKWIHLPALCITFGRVLFSSATLGIYLLIRKQSIRIAKNDAFLLMLAGAILALHWWSFLEAIQLSTVAIGTITFSSFPLFVTLLEPPIFHQRLDKRNVVLAVMILLGVLITIPEFSFENQLFLGILVGMVSALSYAGLTIINKSTFVFRVRVQPSVSDVALLLFLGIITTALAHTLFINSLKTLPAQLAGVCSAMETVYGILFAWLLLGEVPTIREMIGAVTIVGTVIMAQTQAEKLP